MKWLSKLTSSELVGIKLFIFDCDGVVWQGSKAIDGVVAAIESLQLAGYKVAYYTNCCLNPVSEIVKKLIRMGTPLPDPGMVFSAGELLVTYLKSMKLTNHDKVYALAEPGYMDHLKRVGFNVLGGREDANKDVLAFERIEVDKCIKAVVIGGDVTFNYYKLTYATICIKELGAKLLVGNPDTVSHMVPGQLWPCTGSIAKAVEEAAGVKATIVGKPSAEGGKMIMSKFPDIEHHQVMFVGDNPLTDIAFAHNNSMHSTLVLSGVFKENNIAEYTEDNLADYCVNSAKDIQV